MSALMRVREWRPAAENPDFLLVARAKGASCCSTAMALILIFGVPCFPHPCDRGVQPPVIAGLGGVSTRTVEASRAFVESAASPNLSIAARPADLAAAARE